LRAFKTFPRPFFLRGQNPLFVFASPQTLHILRTLLMSLPKGYVRKNGRIEARFRPSSKVELLHDATIAKAFKGCKVNFRYTEYIHAFKSIYHLSFVCSLSFLLEWALQVRIPRLFRYTGGENGMVDSHEERFRPAQSSEYITQLSPSL